MPHLISEFIDSECLSEKEIEQSAEVQLLTASYENLLKKTHGAYRASVSANKIVNFNDDKYIIPFFESLSELEKDIFRFHLRATNVQDAELNQYLGGDIYYKAVKISGELSGELNKFFGHTDNILVGKMTAKFCYARLKQQMPVNFYSHESHEWYLNESEQLKMWQGQFMSDIKNEYDNINSGGGY